MYDGTHESDTIFVQVIRLYVLARENLFTTTQLFDQWFFKSIK